MFGYAPGGGPTTLLGGPLRSKAPQQTFPPASCPDGKPVPPASCPDGKPVQTAGRSRRQASVSTRILSDKPSLPVPGHSKPSLPNRATFCRRAIALRPHPRLSPASHTQKPPPGRATLTPHSAALLRPRHHPNAAPAPPRPAILPESACPTTLVPLPALHSLLLRPRRTGLAAPHPRVHALAQHAPSPLITTHTLTCTHDSPLRNKPPLPCSAPSPSPPEPPPGPDRDRTRHKKTPAPLKVRASVLPNNRRITSRSSRHSPWRPSERPDRRCRRGSSSRPKR